MVLERKKILYVAPYIENSQKGAGIDLKIKGQLSAFRTKYNTVCVSLIPYNKGTNIFVKLWYQLLSQMRFVVYSLKPDVIYYRYHWDMFFYNISLFFISLFSTVWIEHNQIGRGEIILCTPWKVIFHSVQIRILSFSRAKHIALTREIRDKEGLPKKTIIMPNGYYNEIDQSVSLKQNIKVLRHIKSQIMKEKKKGRKVLVFVSSDYSWQGIDRIANLIKRIEKAYLLVIGNFKNNKHLELLGELGLAFRVGYVESCFLPYIYELVDFGIGTFALDRKRMTEACPLKVREYLWYGLPVIINYHDPLLEDKWSKSFIHQVDWSNLNSLIDFLNRESDRNLIKAQSRKHLSWTTVFKESGVV
jgi:hypothetical protein